MPKSLMKALPLPQRKHRFFCRVENFGFFLLLATTDVFAIRNITGGALQYLTFFLQPSKIRELKEKSGLIKAYSLESNLNK